MKQILITFLASLFLFIPHAAAVHGTEGGSPFGNYTEQVKQAEPLPDTKLAAVATLPAVQAPKAVATKPAAAPAVASGTVSGCGDNSYARFIYEHESGCRLNARNAGGCLGIGQACPGSKLTAVCPDLNYSCQNSFFTAYANSAYGGWAGAYNFWLAHRWW